MRLKNFEPKNCKIQNNDPQQRENGRFKITLILLKMKNLNQFIKWEGLRIFITMGEYNFIRRLKNNQILF
jgi:hypothetical protein